LVVKELCAVASELLTVDGNFYGQKMGANFNVLAHVGYFNTNFLSILKHRHYSLGCAIFMGELDHHALGVDESISIDTHFSTTTFS
jgi:hypothetical protein